MSIQKVLVVSSRNVSPEEEIAQRLEELGDGWRVISATTTMVPFGKMALDTPWEKAFSVAEHIYYATTLILEKVP